MDAFWQYWNNLTLRETIIVGIIITVLGGIGYAIVARGWKLLGRLALASVRLIQRLLNWALPLDQSAKLEQKEIQSDPPVPQQQLHTTADSLASLVPLIPKSPPVGFVARRDKEGREIVKVLKEKLAPESNQLVTLWGEGGVGKTTLAAEATRALIGAYKQRIVWATADKRADFTFSTLLDEIATQLNRADLLKLALEPKKAELQALIASAPTLIVLDNFETIAREEQNLCVSFLAGRSPYPSLITTRQKINGVQNIAIDAMSLAEARDFLKRLVKQAGNSLSVSAQERDRIIETAGRNPLVMQWVVAQIELAQRPSDVLDELARGGGDAAQRVFDRSFDLEYLGEDGRAALLALSPFVPSASRPALAEVAGFGSNVERLNEAVKRLAALRLVGTAAGGERLTIQGLTRELAKARLSKDEHVKGYRQRFVAYFLSYAEAHAQPTPEDFNALEAEKDNLLAAMDMAFDSSNWESVVRLLDMIAFPGLLDTRGYWDDAIQRGKQALKAIQLSGDVKKLPIYRGHIAAIRSFRGEYDEARRIYQEALEEFRKEKDEHNISVNLVQLGNIAYRQGEIEEPRRLYNESLEIKRRLGDQKGIAITLHQLATLVQVQGEIEEARRLYDESLEIKRRLGDQSGIASTLHQLAMLAQDQGEIEEARRLYDESLEIKRRLGDQKGIAITLHQLATLVQVQGEIEEARRLYNESLEIAKSLGDQGGIANTLHNLAAIAHAQGEIEEARRLYNESLEIAKSLGDQSGIAISLHQLGLLAEKEGNKVEAVRLMREALSIFEKLKSPTAEISRRVLKRLEGEDS